MWSSFTRLSQVTSRNRSTLCGRHSNGLPGTSWRRRAILERVVPAATYVSRAHPSQVPEYSVDQALQRVLGDIKSRRRKRARKYKRNAVDRQAKGLTTGHHPNETVELAVNLNLDPRKPGQALRGSLELPHGTGKKVNCIVFTANEDHAAAALQAGATHAGGEDLVDRVLNGDVPVDSFQRALATADIMPVVSKKVARLLGPRGLMPNAKVGTLVTSGEELETALQTQLSGKDLQYRTDKEGIVHLPVGKYSFQQEKLLENIGEIMKVIFAEKPEIYGKGKKKNKSGKKGASSKATKYLLKASLSSTQGPGFRLDNRTIDPTSAFFLTSVDKTEKQ